MEVKALRLKDIISKYNLSELEPYRELELTPMQDVFLRRGYIDEEYYDYISYFYEGMVSQSDRDLLLNIKRQISQPYDYHIEKIENFAKELRPYMFEHKSILNIDLLDFIATTLDQKDNFEYFMRRLENDNPPYDFLTEYYTYGKCSQQVFGHIIKWSKAKAWEILCVNSPKDYKATITEAYIKYCGALEEATQIWVNLNYTFLTNHVDNIGVTRCLEIACKSMFEMIQDDNEDLLDCVIENNNYKLTFIAVPLKWTKSSLKSLK